MSDAKGAIANCLCPVETINENVSSRLKRGVEWMGNFLDAHSPQLISNGNRLWLRWNSEFFGGILKWYHFIFYLKELWKSFVGINQMSMSVLKIVHILMDRSRDPTWCLTPTWRNFVDKGNLHHTGWVPWSQTIHINFSLKHISFLFTCEEKIFCWYYLSTYKHNYKVQLKPCLPEHIQKRHIEFLQQLLFSCCVFCVYLWHIDILIVTVCIKRMYQPFALHCHVKTHGEWK